ncbi:murein hydrolase activator EnvC family protein [Cryobacterium serini]|uniref:M23 family metallopeptidase n=1 Tax=Cryobacterium serini TaxID=1259201 RepID=A0A4R9BR91_9MICO|nr:M23 family metallopeptidase [Cryobacterium serini]TFD88868.1 M23 family metallopeptidase [Cryobacterium serini]
MQTLRALAASAVIIVIVGVGAGQSSGAALERRAVSAPTGVAAWVWPVASPHRVTRAFEAPESQYTGGHRGIDLAALANDAVFAPHDGVVSFAGRVVDRPVLSITQPGDLISTVEPVIATVAAGDRVRAGQVIGTVASGGHCPPGCLHFGVRLHGLYVSPLLFLGTVPRAILLPSVP